ncbi:MAG: ABC transporter ATP-binding protein [bacterium]|nr:ABC transporter ATP-binding protein [bacterium]
MSAKVEARNVVKRFGDLVALSDFNLEIAPGEVFGLIGPNGAGKTTFLRVLTGFWLPTSGDVFVDGLSIVKQRFEVQKRIGYACEQPRLYTDHTVKSFLRMIGELRGISGVELNKAVDKSVERFELQPVYRRRIGVLSKGFRQRVSLAQAMLHDPELIVVDEPTVGLDPAQQIELRDIILSFRGRHTVLLCTHQLREAEFCCDRVALLDRGQLVKVSSAAEISQVGGLEELFLSTIEPGAAEK